MSSCGSCRRQALHRGIPAHSLSISIANITLADIMSMATTIRTSPSAHHLSRAFLHHVLHPRDVTLLLIERHHVFLHLAINPDQNTLQVEPKSVALQSDSFTGLTNHDLNALNSDAVKRESQETSYIAAEQTPRSTVASGSTTNFLTDLVVKIIRADASDWEMFKCARNPLSTSLPQTSMEDEWRPNSITGCTLIGLPSNCNVTIIMKRSAGLWTQGLEHDLNGDSIGPEVLLLLFLLPLLLLLLLPFFSPSPSLSVSSPRVSPTQSS